MPDRVEVQDVTAPANSPATAPVEVSLTGVVACQVVRVTIRIPAGHAGLTGIALGYGHNPVLPRTRGRFISGDDEVIVYSMEDYPPGPQWQAFLVNLDTQAHTWEVRFEVNELTALAAAEVHQAIAARDLELIGAGETVGTG